MKGIEQGLPYSIRSELCETAEAAIKSFRKIADKALADTPGVPGWDHEPTIHVTKNFEDGINYYFVTARVVQLEPEKHTAAAVTHDIIFNDINEIGKSNAS